MVEQVLYYVSYLYTAVRTATGPSRSLHSTTRTAVHRPAPAMAYPMVQYTPRYAGIRLRSCQSRARHHVVAFDGITTRPSCSEPWLMRCRRPRNGDCRPPTSHLFHETRPCRSATRGRSRGRPRRTTIARHQLDRYGFVLDVEAAEAAAAGWRKCAEAVQVEALALEEAVAAAAALAGLGRRPQAISSMMARHTATPRSPPGDARVVCMYSWDAKEPQHSAAPHQEICRNRRPVRCCPDTMP